MYPIFRPAEVISLEDPESLGRVQLRIMPELKEIDEGMLPWVFPFGSGRAGKSFSTPVAGSYVYCVIWNKFWSEFSYFPDHLYNPEDLPFKDFLENIAPEIEGLSPEVTGLHIETEKDGLVVFHDTDNSAHGVYHPSGLYCLINSDGDLTVRLATKLVVKDKDGNLELTVDAASKEVKLVAADFKFITEVKEYSFKGDKLIVDGAVEIGSASDSMALFKPLEEVLKELLGHIHAASGGPTGPPMKSSMEPLASLQAKLPNIKSKKVKSE